MCIDVQYITDAIALKRAGEWKKIPTIRAKVRLAVNSLLAQDGRIFEKDAEEILKIVKMNKNKGIKKILGETDVETFAFAIYSATQ